MVQLTKSTKPIKLNEIKRDWHLVDVKGKILGRAISMTVKYLLGKHKSNYSPNLDSGDFVIVINAKQVVVSGKKATSKVYTRYSGYPGGLKRIRYKELIDKNPREVIKKAVSGMLPKNKLRDQRLARLNIYPDEKHPFGEKLKSKS
ncbi:50S ribosomal protein L13 [Candidatus Roizmanbacteria bacterium RIFCSPHIGHO2_01_FULL_39_12c]|uniref:Large ribosomal subunit protein uL13 n=1 Tax=Candidatus Roizmanbacteria bacterium RIFCSPHIGHO2_01_FULL_39_12c TaxID=1802031 RepID=A0A1F7GE75_9BACT|nr:MAG: 50S ribosomal protein L13 [Candidatus Roizmanbacteria bacterium RIFCSPHIGHO2_01_FULL_39_12c]OGK47563.1 MAG: 50S ribosomal protein L13 [Candidatus Roizmanbacteria bacterium RIFCSPLOWO2_01_FULL_40_13]